MSTLKEQLAAIKPARKPVQFGDAIVYVRRMSKGEKLTDLVATKDVENDVAGLFRHLAEVLVKVCQDEAGNPVWSADDVDQVMGLADNVFDDLLAALYGTREAPLPNG